MLVYSRVEENKMSYADATRERPHTENRNTTQDKMESTSTKAY